jgi:hypothetical protein
MIVFDEDSATKFAEDGDFAALVDGINEALDLCRKSPTDAFNGAHQVLTRIRDHSDFAEFRKHLEDTLPELGDCLEQYPGPPRCLFPGLLPV